MNPQHVAFIGLGAMGFPMAGHISRAGYRVSVFNRTRARAVEWSAEYQGEVCDSVAEAVARADVVLTCVGGDADLREIYFSAEGILSRLKKGALVVDHTSASHAIAKELGEAVTSAGGLFLDAPVSGGAQGAQAATLAIMAGGSSEAYSRAKPVLDCYGARIALLGDNGAGQLCKLANQLCIAGTLQGIAEAFSFILHSRLDPEQVLEILSAGAANSAQLPGMARQIIDNDYANGFAVEWMLKDLENCLDYAQTHGLEVPAAAVVKDKYSQLKQLGCGRNATPILFKSLYQCNGENEG